MVILRATRTLMRSLPPFDARDQESDTALGDWYAKRLVVDRRPLVLLVSAGTLLPVLIPARAVRSLPDRLGELVGIRLRRMGVSRRLIAAELAAMEPVRIGPTQDRSVLGILVDFGKMIPSYLPVDEWDDSTLPFVESRLAETPSFAGGPSERVVFPEKAAPAALDARWHAA
jgi:hypothetical protein